ncbi:MAG: hypothetical protein ABMA64_10905 [Myxococcota bacterium]
MFWIHLSLAHASATYPATLEAELGMPCTPACTVCHDSNLGGAGTVTAPFGAALVDAGVTGGSQTELLASALAALDADSDADGAPDTEELSAGDDPNGGDPLCGGGVTAPEYGCLDQGRSSAGLFGVLLAGALVRRHRARAPAHTSASARA